MRRKSSSKVMKTDMEEDLYIIRANVRRVENKVEEVQKISYFLLFLNLIVLGFVLGILLKFFL